MKKLAFVGAVIAAAAFATPASADTLALSGQIDYQCDLSLAGQNAGSINLLSGQHPLGSFNVTCNDPEGFEMTIDSANDGALVNGSYTVDYQLVSSAQSGVNDLAFGQTTPDIARTVNGFSVGHADADGADYGLQLRTGAGGVVLPGGLALTDTLTFTVSGL